MEEKTFVRIIIAVYAVVFLVSYSFKFDFLYYPLINNVVWAGIISVPLFPILGLLIYPIAVFLQTILPKEIGILPVALSTIYTFAAFGGLFWFINSKLKEKRHNFNDILALALLVLLHILLLYHHLPIAFSNYRYVLFLDAVLIYFVVSRTVYKKEILRLFLWILIIACMVFVFRFVHHAGTFQESIPGFENNGISRDLVFIVPILIYLFWSEKDKYLKGILFFSLAFLMPTLLALGSRAAWISLAPLLIVIGVKNIKRKTTWVFGALAILMVILYVLTSVQLTQEWISIVKETPKGESSEEASISQRYQLIRISLELFRERPILGWGPGQTENTLEQQTGLYRNTHNAYLELMVGWGLFGLLFYLALFGYSIRNLYRAQKIFKRRDEFLYNLSQGILFGLIVVGLNQFMINESHEAMVWIGFGLSTALYNLAIKSSKVEEKSKKSQSKEQKNKKFKK